MSTYIEQILQKLLTPDNATIKQATKQLLDYFVSDKCINGLVEVLKTSQNTQYRIYAATLLRKKVKNWKSLNPKDKICIKQHVIEILVKEPEETVRKQIMYLIASTYKYSFKSKQEWPELFTFMQELIASSSGDQNLAGIYMISILNEEAPEEMKSHYLNIMKLFSPILKNATDLKPIEYVLSSLKNIIPFISSEEVNELSVLIPDTLNATAKIINSNQDKDTITCVFDFLQAIVEYEVNAVSPYLTNIVEMVLQVIANQSLTNSTRSCALNYINFLIEMQKTTLIKKDMLNPIVSTIFTLMCQSDAPLQTKSDMEIDDDDEDDDENLFTCATQVLDYCALYFPPKKLIKILIEYVKPAVVSENPLQRRAAFAALAVTSEGCADYYRNHYLELLVDLCIKGVFDSDVEVVSTAFFALCQFSEYLQPNIVHYANRIMHMLIQYIEQQPQLKTVSRLTVRFYDALQSFCENLGDELLTYIDALMEKLMGLVTQQSPSHKIQRLIICTFSSIVTSIKANFHPYFDAVVNMIKPYLVTSSGDKNKNPTEQQFELKLLQIECIDLMGILAKYMNQEKFTPSLINDCLIYVQQVLSNEDDADIRSAVYDLLAGLTNKLKESLPLTQLMPQILETLKSEEGIHVIDNDDKKSPDGLFSAFDEIDLDETEETDEKLNEDEDEDIDDDADDDEDSQKLVIENEYVAEKLSALYCLQEACKYVNPQLITFYSACIDEAKNLSLFNHLHIRKESYLALAYLISFYYEYCKTGAVPPTANNVNPVDVLNKDLSDYFAACIKAIELDANRQLVMCVFDSLSILMNKCAPFIKENLAIYGATLDKLGNLVIQAFKNKIFCQTVSEDDEGEEQTSAKTDEDMDENQAEYDYMIKEYAGDLIPSLALCLPEDLFDKYFEKVLHFLYRILNKPESTVAEKSFVIGVIGETVANLNALDQTKAVNVYKVLRNYLNDHDDEVRSNTIFTIGVLCSQSNGALQAEYEQLVKDLFELSTKERNKQAIDNICGSLCRVCIACISTNLTNVDFTPIFNKIFELTPLKTDHNEYETIYTLISKTLANNMLLNYYPKLIELSGFVLFNKHYECKQGIKELIVKFLKHACTEFSQDFNNLLNQIKTEYSNMIRSTLSVQQQ